MTEDEAKTKWCPMVGGKPSKEFPRVTNCIASECMWWVWDGGELSPNGLHDSRTGHCGAVK